MAKPIFIFSLPRAGSTLLQRLLITDGRCKSIGEPSFLLRLLGTHDPIHRRSTYGEDLVDIGVADLRDSWTGYDQTYREGVRQLAASLYGGLAGDNYDWFLDKTPRYHLIADEIIKTFPEAKFILLWRHPLAVASSIASTFRHGCWELEQHDVDLHAGMEALYAVKKNHADQIHELYYEDLVTNPRLELERLGNYLGWNGLSNVLDQSLAADNAGRMGDPTGVQKYSKVSEGSRDAWVRSYKNWYRRQWAKRYYSTERGTIAKSLGYELPDWDSAGAPRQYLEGVIECLSARKRLRRRITHPVFYARFSRKNFKEKGYWLTFN